MSLDWSTTDCKEPGAADDCERNARACLVWACLSLDMNGITEKNVPEWMFRLQYQHRTGLDWVDIIYLGKPLYDSGAIDCSTSEMTLGDWNRVHQCLLRWVGLRTNVSQKTRASWLKRANKCLAEDAERGARQAMEDPEVGVSGRRALSKS